MKALLYLALAAAAWIAVAALAIVIASAMRHVAHAAPAASPAWLEDTWDHDGGPAITLGPNGSALLVLPQSTLEGARRAGLTTEQAVTIFLERWGQHCAGDGSIADLDKAQTLHVKLSLSRRTPLDGLYITDDEEDDLTIEYAPARQAVCVKPWEGPTS